MRRIVALAAAIAALAAVPASAHVTPMYASGPAVGQGWLAAPQTDSGCPQKVDQAKFATPDQIYADDAKMASFGCRATASPAHARFIDWIEKRLKTLPG